MKALQRIAARMQGTLVLTDADRIDTKLIRTMKPDPTARARSERSKRGWETKRRRSNG